MDRGDNNNNNSVVGLTPSDGKLGILPGIAPFDFLAFSLSLVLPSTGYCFEKQRTDMAT